MRSLKACCLALLLVLAPLSAHAQRSLFDAGEQTAGTRLLEWIYAYKARPDPRRLPEAVKAMRRQGLFRDTEKADFFVGFIAGVIGQNAKQAPALVKAMFPMPAKEQEVIVKAIAWSGLADWQDLLQRFRSRMPHRQALVDQYLFGEEKTLMEIPLETGPATLYALWGYYVATGDYAPVARVISALRWSKGAEPADSPFMRRLTSAFTVSGDDDALTLATIGGTAKWTLVTHAERDRELIDLYRVQAELRDEITAAKLREVIAAAEAFESERIRKEEFAAIEDIRRRNPEGAGFNRATTLGSVAIATGCVAATAAGQAYIAVPCIVTGAVYSGFVKLLRGNP